MTQPGDGSGGTIGATWLVAVAIAMLAAAGVFFVLALNTAEARSALLVGALILAFLGMVTFAMGIRARASARRTPSGAGADAAGSTDQPWPVAGTEPPANAATSETLEQVQEALQASGAVAAKPFTFAEQGGYTVDQLRQFLREHGLDATARIDSLQDTGQTVGTDRLVIMRATVMVPGKPPHESGAATAMVPQDKVSKLSVGMTVPCKVAPDNPDAVTFLWEQV